MLAESDIRSLIEQRYMEPMKDISILVEKNKSEIEDEFSKSYNSSTKEEMLLHFRRAIEMLVRADLLLSVTTLSNDKVVAIRKENFLQFVDDRYYTPLHLSCFMDIFKIETKDFKCISNTIINEPHIGLVINYILEHFTNTFTRFLNRNWEDYYIYEFFHKNGKEIKEVLAYLNSYHYLKDEDWITLYNTELEDIKKKILPIYNEVKNLLEKI